MDLLVSGRADAFVESLLVALQKGPGGEESSGGDLKQESLAVALLGKAKELLSDSLRIVTQKLTKQMKDEVAGGAAAAGGAGAGGDVFLKMDDVAFFEPRGRFTASFTLNGLLLEGKNANCFVPWTSVSHAAAFPSNTTTKKEGEDLLALRVSPSVKFSGKDLNGILFNLNKCLGTPVKATTPPSELVSSTALEGIAAVVVPKIVELLWKKTVVAPRKDLFQTIGVGPGGATRPYLRCHKGVQEGAIYPLSNGVVFVKPLLFLPAEEIASLSAGRGGGSGQTRYVDLKIETADDKEYEFVNIEREELPALQNYVKGYLEARAKEEAERKLKIKKEAGGAEEDEDESDDEDDDDFDPDASDDDGDDSDDSDASSGSDDEDDDNSAASASNDEESVSPRAAAKKIGKSPIKKLKKAKSLATGGGQNEIKGATEDAPKENHRPETGMDIADSAMVPETAPAVEGEEPLAKRVKAEE
jgi:hypothetical protein